MDITKTDEVAKEILNVVKMMEEQTNESDYKYSRIDVIRMSAEEIQIELELQYYRGVENGIKIIQETISRMSDIKED